MAELKYSVRFPADEASGILARLIERYVDKEKLKRYRLLWNSLSGGTAVSCLPVEAIVSLPLAPDKAVLFYDERQRMLCETAIKDVIHYVQGFAPWDEVDACVFDREMDWVVSITHEDKILCWGSIVEAFS